MGFTLVSKEDDRRGSERYRCPEQLFRVVDSARGQELGYLMDISLGGLAFYYYQDNEVLEESGAMDIVSSNGGPTMRSLPYQNVTDFDMLGSYPFDIRRRRRRGIRFEDLPTERLVELRQFIQMMIV
jgi:hypothetical protein